MLGTLGSLSVSLSAETASFIAAMDKAAYQTQKSFESMATKATAFGVGLGIALERVAEKLFEFGKDSVTTGDQLEKMAIRSGIAIETLAGLKLAAETSDTSMEDLGKAMGRLEIFAGKADTGNKQFSATLTALGVTSRDPYKMLVQLADATTRLTDPTQRAAALNAILGKSYQNLMPLLEQGGDRLQTLIDKGRELTPVTEESARKSAEFKDSLTELKIAAEGLAIAETNKMLPALNEITKAMTEAAHQSGLLKSLWVGLGGLGVATYTDHFADAQTRLATAQRALNDAIRNGAKDDAPAVIAARQRIALIEDEITADKKLAAFQAFKASQQGVAPISLPKDLFGSGASSRALADPLASAKNFSAEIQKQIATFGQSDLAVMQYRVTLGDLAPALDKAGAAGARLRAQILAQAQSLYGLKQAEEDHKFDLEVIRSDEQMAADAAQQHQEIMQAGAAVYDATRTPAELLNREIERLNFLLQKGAVDWDTYARAQIDAQNKFEDATKKTKKETDQMTEIARQAARNIQDAFANFLYDPFKNGVKGMVTDFANALRKMLSEALASQFFKWLAGVFSNSGSSILQSLGGIIGAHDLGGSIATGSLGIVGERGPEIIAGPATVMPTRETASLLGGQSKPQSIKVVLVDDRSRIGDYMSSSEGEQVMLASLRRNARTVRAMLA